MLEIVLLVLKITGMILAAILGILIIALFCVLFVPIKYKGDFSVSDAEDGEKKEVAAMLYASWMLWLVRAYASYEDAFRVRVKILFFTLVDTAREKKVSKNREKPKKDKRKVEKTAANQEKEAEKTVTDKEKNTESATERTNEKEKAKSIRAGTKKETVHEASKEKKQEEAQNEKMREATGEKKGKKKQIYNILQTIRNFCDKLKKIKEKAEKIEELWHSGHMERSRTLFGKELVYLLKHTKPRKLKGYLHFGLKDPSITGYAMAGYGILYPIWTPKLSVEPDFEKEVLDCRIKMKGKIRGCHFVKSGLVLFFSKDVRRVITDVKKL